MAWQAVSSRVRWTVQPRRDIIDLEYYQGLDDRTSLHPLPFPLWGLHIFDTVSAFSSFRTSFFRFLSVTDRNLLFIANDNKRDPEQAVPKKEVVRLMSNPDP